MEGVRCILRWEIGRERCNVQFDVGACDSSEEVVDAFRAR
jgi:hypothetical protein